MDRKPLVLDDAAQLEQIQTGDEIDAVASGVVSKRDFDELASRHNLLIELLIGHGIELPSELLIAE